MHAFGRKVLPNSCQKWLRKLDVTLLLYKNIYIICVYGCIDVSTKILVPHTVERNFGLIFMKLRRIVDTSSIGEWLYSF